MRTDASAIQLGLHIHRKFSKVTARDGQGKIVRRCRSRTVANVLSIGFVVRRCIQCSAGSQRMPEPFSRAAVVLHRAWVGPLPMSQSLARLCG